MSLHRFYIAPERCSGDTLRLEGREAHHALHVLRLKGGDDVTVLDGTGNEFRCKVENTSRDSLTVHVGKKNSIPPPPCSITLFVGIPRGKIIESIIQKSVELGARQVVPLLTERVVTHLDGDSAEHKRDKWQQVAVEAIKQCGAVWLPTIGTPCTVAEALGRHNEFDLALVGSLQTERRHPSEIFAEFKKNKGRKPRTVGIWVGPEGDFTLEELLAIEKAGAKPITLGNFTLRVETAAIYCLSVLNYELNG